MSEQQPGMIPPEPIRSGPGGPSDPAPPQYPPPQYQAPPYPFPGGGGPHAAGAYPVAGFAPPGYGQVVPRTNGLAVASLVFGIASIVMCPLSGIVGLITGIKARADIRRSQGAEAGEGLALGGIITSIVGLVLIGFMVLAIVAITFLGRSATSKFSVIGPAVPR